MSDYWKSIRKYWCKHCKTFVKDTKLEKQNHEATPKHQGNLKRFLRDLHRGNERDERDKQRAKDEVARLNGVPPGSTSLAYGGNNDTTSRRRAVIPQASSSTQQATPVERKQQMAKLAEMGISIPEEYRREMAMAGEWQTTSERLIYDTVKTEEENKDVKPNGLNIGIRKRKVEGREEEEGSEERVIRKAWGSTTRTYPSAEADRDLDELLNSTSILNKSKESVGEAVAAPEFLVSPVNQPTTLTGVTAVSGPPRIKRESSGEAGGMIPDNNPLTEISVKREDELSNEGVLFKKRKSRPIRKEMNNAGVGA